MLSSVPIFRISSFLLVTSSPIYTLVYKHIFDNRSQPKLAIIEKKTLVPHPISTEYYCTKLSLERGYVVRGFEITHFGACSHQMHEMMMLSQEGREGNPSDNGEKKCEKKKNLLQSWSYI
jgi:hypothetical protein